MIEEYVQKAWELLKEFKRITPLLIMRKLKVTMDMAQKICNRVWLRMHKEARQAAIELDCNWPTQLDRVKLKNLDKFKKKQM